MRAAGLTLLVLSILCAGCTKGVGELCEKDRECEFACEFPPTPAVSAARRICTQKCDSDPDCPSEAICYGGSCVLSCEDGGACPEGSVCWEGVCAVACRDQADCSMGTCLTPGDVCQ